MTPQQTQAMRKALEALERYSGVDQRACDAENALRTALEQMEKQEPYLFYVHTREPSPFSVGGKYIEFFDWYEPDEIPTDVEIVSKMPVYTRPAERKFEETSHQPAAWMSLTDEEIDNINYTSAHMLAREVEIKLRELNMGKA